MAIGPSAIAVTCSLLAWIQGPPGPVALPSLWGITVGSPIAEVERVLGAGVKFRREEGEGESATRQCYQSGKAGDETIIVFVLAAFGRYEEAVTAFLVGRSTPSALLGAKCVRSEVVTRKMQLSNGLKLGDTESHVRRTLGVPTRSDPLQHTLEYKSTYHRDVGDRDRAAMLRAVGVQGADRFRSVLGYQRVVVSLAKGRVVQIDVSLGEEWE